MTLFKCECGKQWNLSDDKRFEVVNGGEGQRLFAGCTCSRGKDSLVAIAALEKELSQ